MKHPLLNPNWSFEGSTHFGCRERHLPLESGYAPALPQGAGHDVLLIDAQLVNLSMEGTWSRLGAFCADSTVVCSAPSYLFWRCATPELRVPELQQWICALQDIAGTIVDVGPHASTTAAITLRKLRADVVVMGECQDILPQLTGAWSQLPSICYPIAGTPWVQDSTHATDTHATDMETLAPIRREQELIQAHTHPFDAQPVGPGNPVEASRGFPHHYTFCAGDNFHDIELPGRAGCVSMEAGAWANQPVPLFPYQGSPDYTRRWGAPDNRAWERAADCYSGMFDQFSDIQESRPLPLKALEIEEGIHR